nr:hypothetical protein [Exiguobacterium sp. LL15]
MQRDSADFKPKKGYGVIIGNPPHCERPEDAREVHQLY